VNNTADRLAVSGTYTDEMLRKRAIATQRGVADYAGYCQLADGTEPMLSEAPLYLDAGIPPIFGVGGAAAST